MRAVEFTEDPSEGADSEDSVRPDASLPRWKTLDAALAQAIGPVLYTRHWWTFDIGAGPILGWLTRAVAIRRPDTGVWVVDHAATHRTYRDEWEDGWDPDWVDDLNDDDRLILNVLRATHRAYETRTAPGPVATSLGVGGGDYLDHGWVQALTIADPNTWVGAIGRRHLVSVGRFSRSSDAQAAVADEIERRRDRAAQDAARLGPLGRMFAAGRPRWLTPMIEFVPQLANLVGPRPLTNRADVW